MTRPLLLALLAIAAASAPSNAGPANRGVDTVHQPIVERSDFVLDVSGNGLDAADAQRIRQWFGAIGLRYGDRVSIDTSVGDQNSNRDIAALVADHGLFVSAGAPVTRGAITPGDVRIVISRSTATVSGCPDYSRPSQPNFSAASSSNYGCGTNSTLAAMVANPEDLVRGQADALPSPETAAKAIKLWRNADPTAKGGLKIESTKAGN